MTKKCRVSGCPRPNYAKSYCRTHYEAHRLGRVLKPIGPRKALSIRDRLASKVVLTGDHQLWIGQTKGGRGVLNIGGNKRKVAAHRLMHEAFIGPIPKDHHVWRTCGLPLCVAPKHLLAVAPGRKPPLRAANARSDQKMLLAMARAGYFDEDGQPTPAVQALLKAHS